MSRLTIWIIHEEFQLTNTDKAVDAYINNF